MTTFTLSITLGNDAMRTPADLHDALKGVLTNFDKYDTEAYDVLYVLPTGRVYDDNGNRVGHWAVSEPESAEAIAERLAADWSNDGETLDVDYRLALAAVRIARGEA